MFYSITGWLLLDWLSKCNTICFKCHICLQADFSYRHFHILNCFFPEGRGQQRHGHKWYRYDYLVRKLLTIAVFSFQKLRSQISFHEECCSDKVVQLLSWGSGPSVRALCLYHTRLGLDCMDFFFCLRCPQTPIHRQRHYRQFSCLYHCPSGLLLSPFSLNQWMGLFVSF